MKSLSLLIGIVLLTTSQAYATLVAHYQFDGNGIDAVGGNNGQVTGAIGAADRFGNSNSALRFDGVDDFARIPNAPQINFQRTQDFSVAFWVKADSIQSDTVHSDNDIIEKWSGSQGYPFVVRYINQSSSSNGTIHAARWNGSNSAGVSSSPTTINDNQFHHVAFTKTGNTLSFYVDGILLDTGSNLSSGDTTNNSDLFIAKRGNNVNFFAGTLDDLRIYDHGLSQQEVTQLNSVAVPEASTYLLLLVALSLGILRHRSV